MAEASVGLLELQTHCLTDIGTHVDKQTSLYNKSDKLLLDQNFDNVFQPYGIKTKYL